LNEKPCHRRFEMYEVCVGLVLNLRSKMKIRKANGSNRKHFNRMAKLIGKTMRCFVEHRVLD
jgi:hypothetical protein